MTAPLKHSFAIAILVLFGMVSAFAISPSKGELIFEDDFSHPDQFYNNWTAVHNHIKPTLEDGSFYFPAGGSVVMKRETPKEFYAEMDIEIPPNSNAQHPARAGFNVCGKTFLMSHEGCFFVFRGPKIEDFEFGKPVRMVLIRRRKSETESEWVYRINGVEYTRFTASDINTDSEQVGNNGKWSDLQIWSYSLPIRVSYFAIWTLIEDPRGPSPNLIVNSSFESVYDGYPELFERKDSFSNPGNNILQSYDNYLGLVRVDNTQKHSGDYSLRLENDGSISSQGVLSHTGASDGVDCVFSLYMKADREAFPVTLSYGTSPKNVLVGTEWARFELLGKGAENLRGPSVTFKEQGVLWIDDLQLEPVTLPTESDSPAPTATEYRPSDLDELYVFFQTLNDSDVLEKPDEPTLLSDPVERNRALGKDIDGNPLKPIEILSRLSFYMTEPDAVFRLTINVPIPEGAYAIVNCLDMQKRISLSPKETRGTKVDTAFHISGLSAGTYQINAEVFNVAGESIAAGEGTFKVLAYRKGASQINHFSRCVMHDGEPVVPVTPFISGLYNSVTASSNIVARKLNLYKVAGFESANGQFPFNWVEPEDDDPYKNNPNIKGITEFLEGTERRGMLSVLWTEGIRFSDAKIAQLGEFLAPRTNILAHLVLDEPEVNTSYTAEQAAAHVRRMREMDPYHPMFMDQVYYGIPANYAGRETDIFMNDDYLTNNHRMRTVASVVDNAVNMWNYGIEKGVPVWFFLVSANMPLHGREPSYDQQIAQTYGCLAAGCSGFSYFYGTSITPGNWRAMRQIARELKELTPVIGSESICGKTVSDVNESSLRVRTMRYKDALYVVTCNIESKALGEVNLTLPPNVACARSAEVMVEDRELPITSGRILTDNFSRWERHVYKIPLRTTYIFLK